MSASDYPRITIVTPSFNQAALLEECINSVVSQGYPNLEYIVMDGGSRDGSVEVIKKHSAHIAFWQSQPDAGPYAAVNEGFGRSTGEIMGWLNSDDMLHSGGLLTLATVFSGRPEIEFLTGRVANFDEHGNLKEAAVPLMRWCRDCLLVKHNFSEDQFITVTQETTFWRRSLWDRAGGSLDLSLKLAADFELWARFMRTAQLHTVDARIGGFRSHSKDQRSVRFVGDYRKESLSVIEREQNLNLPPREEYHCPPPVISLSSCSSGKREANIPLRAKDFPRKPVDPGYPKISIVTVCCNQRRYLDQCIESVLGQGWPNLEYIMVDCGSTDGSLEIIEAYNAHLAVLPNRDRLKGFEAVNYAFQHATGDIMAWLSPEDKYHEKALLYAAGVLYRRPDIQWIIGRTTSVQENGDLRHINIMPVAHARRNWLKMNVLEPFIHRESIFWKSSLWKRSGGTLNTRWKHAADFELWLRLSRYAELQSTGFLLAGYRHETPGRYSNYTVEYLQEVHQIVEQEIKGVGATPFDNKVPPAPIISLVSKKTSNESQPLR